MDANEILMETAIKNNDGFLSGQIKWILEAMEEYAKISKDKISHLKFELKAADADNARLTAEKEVLIGLLEQSINTGLDSAGYERMNKILQELK